ncbi:hypothetical protein KAJ27_20085, partial [bacterium]|nr:hypothetical protein [bacterium]
INKISKSVDLGKKINCLRIFENILYGLSNGIIYKIVENKLIKVLSVEKYRDKIIDFYKSGEDWYILTNIENGKVFKLNSNSDVLLSFPDFVEESPLFKFPGMLFLSNENKMICVQDYYFGRAVCIDYENGIVKSVISDRSNGILIPELFFITCSFNSKQYFINICDANGNTYDKKGPFELENSISIVRLFHKVSKNGDFMIYLEDVSGNGYIETYDSQANLINRISKTISISVIRDRKFDFDSKALYFIRGKSKLVTIDLF